MNTKDLQQTIDAAWERRAEINPGTTAGAPDSPGALS